MPVCTIFNTFGNVLKSFDTHDYGRTITIGRSEECDICLLGITDNTVSRRQLVLKKSGSIWNLENVGHATLFKNGEEMESAETKEGDVFRFSGYFLCMGPKTGPSKYELAWTFDTENRQKRGVLWPGVNIIGSSKENEITIRNEEISRHHGKVTVEGDQVFYEKAHDSCRVSINGRSIGKKKVQITMDDEIVLGTDCPITLTKNTRKSIKKVQGNVSGREVQNAKSNSMAGVVIALLAMLVFLLLIAVIYSLLF